MLVARADPVRVDAVEVLQVAADIGVAVLHRLGRRHTRQGAAARRAWPTAGAAVVPVTVTSAPLVSSASTRACAS